MKLRTSIYHKASDWNDSPFRWSSAPGNLVKYNFINLAKSTNNQGGPCTMNHWQLVTMYFWIKKNAEMWSYILYIILQWLTTRLKEWYVAFFSIRLKNGNFEHETPPRYKPVRKLRGLDVSVGIDLSMIDLISGGGGGHGLSREKHSLYSQLGSSVPFFGEKKEVKKNIT